MKTLIIILAGAVGLTGCMTMSHHRGEEGMDAGLASSYSGKSDEHHPSSQRVKGGDPYVRKLPPEAQAELAKVGIKDIAFLVAVDFNGTTRLLKPEKVKYTEGRLPVKEVKVIQLKPISILAFEGSNCIVMADGSQGTWQKDYYIQGTWYTGYCRPGGESPF